jgi:hypothetical protein
MRGWPVATIAFYGADANRASEVVVGIVASEHRHAGAPLTANDCEKMRDAADTRTAKKI